MFLFCSFLSHTYLKTYPGISCCAEKLIKFGMNVLWDMRNTKQSSKVWVGILVFILFLFLEYTYMSLFLKNIKKVNTFINCTFFM